MKVKYLGESDKSTLIKNKIYDVISTEGNGVFKSYRIIDETGEDYLYSIENFESIVET